jgi:hypothetical protein
MNRDIEIEHNMTLRRPEWQFLAGFGWAEGNVEEVVAVRFGPNETVIAKAQSPALKDAGTRLTIELMCGRSMRRAAKEIKEPLPYLTEASLVQHWGRMITAAQEWPWK